MPAASPNLIFQIVSAKHSTAEEKWKPNANRYPTFYAYHGSRLENFHSIVHYGLQQNMCKVRPVAIKLKTFFSHKIHIF